MRHQEHFQNDAHALAFFSKQLSDPKVGSARKPGYAKNDQHRSSSLTLLEWLLAVTLIKPLNGYSFNKKMTPIYESLLKSTGDSTRQRTLPVAQVVWVFRKTRWVALLSTDLELSVEQIIEVYRARSKIESCFKEIKQEIGKTVYRSVPLLSIPITRLIPP